MELVTNLFFSLLFPGVSRAHQGAELTFHSKITEARSPVDQYPTFTGIVSIESRG